MNDNIRAWQADSRRAFDWIARVYDQSHVLMDDAQGMFEDDGWSTEIGNGMGGVATTSVLNDWPFVYLKVFGAMEPSTPSDAAQGRAALFGILFHDGNRPGPVCVGAKVEWSDADAQCDHWMVFAAISDEWQKGAFDRTNGPVSIAVPTKKGRERWPGVDRLTWFEVPLAAISSPDVLKDVVDATKQLIQGDDQPARDLIKTLG